MFGNNLARVETNLRQMNPHPFLGAKLSQKRAFLAICHAVRSVWGDVRFLQAESAESALGLGRIFDTELCPPT